MDETPPKKSRAKASEENKNAIISIRLTELDKQKLKAVIPEGSVGLALRDAAIKIAKSGFFLASEKTDRRQIIATLGRMASNINQMARVLNTDKSCSGVERVMLAATLDEFREELRSIRAVLVAENSKNNS